MLIPAFFLILLVGWLLDNLAFLAARRQEKSGIAHEVLASSLQEFEHGRLARECGNSRTGNAGPRHYSLQLDRCVINRASISNSHRVQRADSTY